MKYLREKKGIEHISVYGQSMGSIFAVLVAQYIGGMENLTFGKYRKENLRYLEESEKEIIAWLVSE